MPSASIFAGVQAAVDPAAQSRPSPFAFYAFAFLGLALVGLLVSMSRHLRTVRRNFGDEPSGDAAPPVTDAAPPVTDAAQRSEPPR